MAAIITMTMSSNLIRSTMAWATTSCEPPIQYIPKSMMSEADIIPSIIHHSWKTTELPKKFSIWRDSWRDQHPFWEHKLWTDEDNLKLCTEDFSWFLPTYNSMLQNISRADVVRYMYMYKYGGFYADLDVECIKNHRPLARWGGAIVPLMSDDYYFNNNIPNAWMASVPKHPFWMFLLKRIASSPLPSRVEAVAGPMALREGLVAYSALYGVGSSFPIHHIEPGVIFPYDWHKPGNNWSTCSAQSSQANFTMCKQDLDPEHRAYTITYWSHTWGDGTQKVDTNIAMGENLLYRRMNEISVGSVYREMRG
ncbi:hypothetical protein BDV3_002897 [Batrachochytrium dendrobatidis]